jgi:hypothetical protein
MVQPLALVMINYVLERQAEMMRRLIEERDEKFFADSNVHPSSCCVANFGQTNPQPSDTSAGDTS